MEELFSFKISILGKKRFLDNYFLHICTKQKIQWIDSSIACHSLAAYTSKILGKQLVT